MREPQTSEGREARCGLVVGVGVVEVQPRRRGTISKDLSAAGRDGRGACATAGREGTERSGWPCSDATTAILAPASRIHAAAR